MSDITSAELLEQAAAAVEENQHMVAVEMYTELLSRVSPHTTDAEEKEMRLTALNRRGRVLHLMGEPEAALDSYEQYYLEAGGNRHAVDALVLIGNQRAYMGQSQRALQAHEEALQLAEALNYSAGRAQAFGGKGLTLTYLGRVEEAVASLKKSLALFEQVDDLPEQARSWNRIGVAHIRLGELDKAIHAFKQAYDLASRAAETTEDPANFLTTVMINALNNVGECYQSLFDMKQAMVYHEKGLRFAEKYDLPSLAIDLSRNQGVNLCYLGRFDEGIEHLYRALKVSKELNRPDIYLQTLYSLALAELELGNLEQGREHAAELKEMAEKSRAQGYQADAYHALGLYYFKSGDHSMAEQSWQQALFLAHETARRMILWQVHAALAEIALAPELGIVHKRIAAEVIQQVAEPIEDEALREKFLTAPKIKEILDAAQA